MSKLMTTEEFISSPIDHCPCCKGNDLIYSPLAHRFGSVACDVTCQTCKAAWTQEYVKLHYVNLVEGDLADDGIPGEDDNDGHDIADCPECLGNKVVAGHVCPRCGGEGHIHPEAELQAAERGMK